MSPSEALVLLLVSDHRGDIISQVSLGLLDTLTNLKTREATDRNLLTALHSKSLDHVLNGL